MLARQKGLWRGWRLYADNDNHNDNNDNDNKKNMVLYPGALPALWSTRIWQCHIVANNRQLSVGWLSDWSQTTWNDGKSRKQDEVHSHMWAWAGISYNNNHVDFTLSDLKIFAQRCAVKAPHASSAESTNGMKPCVIALAAALHDLQDIDKW